MKNYIWTVLLIVFLNGCNTTSISKTGYDEGISNSSEAPSPQKRMADSSSSFHFEKVESFHEMFDFFRKKFPLGSPKNDLRRVFVEDGKATLKEHPKDIGIEKYIYDINLCSYYIWRWNISVDYDQIGHLQQAYINGNTVFPEGKQKKSLNKESIDNKSSKIFQAVRLRPEAHKGQSSLAYLLFDVDVNSKTLGDQELIGSGPSRPDPLNMGNMIVYNGVDPWRSIFDSDEADHIAPYAGDCVAVDQAINQMKSKAN